MFGIGNLVCIACSHQDKGVKNPKPEFLYSDLREKWKYEHELINHRITWLLNTQAFFLAAYGLLAKLNYDIKAHDVSKVTKISMGEQLVCKIETLPSGHNDKLVDYLITPISIAEFLIPIFSCFVVLILWSGINAAQGAMLEIKNKFNAYQKKHTLWRDIRVDIADKYTKKGVETSLFLPILLLIMWGFLFLVELIRVYDVYSGIYISIRILLIFISWLLNEQLSTTNPSLP
ncbi:hypothetical protein Ctha_1132 [Chloroherpeton thalassium ATCC 35110]|uniref:Uncharacterized protein n=1 Tax=Chloroherpeton thalassium (strain ATCC 35110 / GB-78) TaxID=517418 RepID=B3QYG8_CHLT3|nr:hypothetical protein [Chloroherpeton thalassium]ACF13596.1 hypothetical protein Ctha_1132 [Chloroherpeton thalassium ATCC 35110]